jgi:hypothetical protein
MANRRVQGGGDPAQGPLRDEIRTMPGSDAAESFPDVPPGNRADVPASSSADAHDVDLDAFAERMGLRDEGDRRPDDGADRSEPTGRLDIGGAPLDGAHARDCGLGGARCCARALERRPLARPRR